MNSLLIPADYDFDDSGDGTGNNHGYEAGTGIQQDYNGNGSGFGSGHENGGGYTGSDNGDGAGSGNGYSLHPFSIGLITEHHTDIRTSVALTLLSTLLRTTACRRSTRRCGTSSSRPASP